MFTTIRQEMSYVCLSSVSQLIHPRMSFKRHDNGMEGKLFSDIGKVCVSTTTCDLLFRQICVLGLVIHKLWLDISKFLLPPKNQIVDSIIEKCPKLGMGPPFDQN